MDAKQTQIIHYAHITLSISLYIYTTSSRSRGSYVTVYRTTRKKTKIKEEKQWTIWWKIMTQCDTLCGREGRIKYLVRTGRPKCDRWNVLLGYLGRTNIDFHELFSRITTQKFSIRNAILMKPTLAHRKRCSHNKIYRKHYDKTEQKLLRKKGNNKKTFHNIV